MHRKGFTLVEIMVVVMIIGVIMMIALPGWMKIRQTTRQKSCWETLRVVDDAKQHWAMDMGEPTGSVPTSADLVPTYMKKDPVCPEGGTITIGSNDEPAKCSIHGFAP